MDQDRLSPDNLPCPNCPLTNRVLAFLSPSVFGAAFKILAIGLVLAVLEIIALAFVYPTQLNTVIGVVTPIITVLWHLHSRKRIGQNGEKRRGNSDLPD